MTNKKASCITLLKAIIALLLIYIPNAHSTLSDEVITGSQSDFRQETIYFVFLDRFSDGDVNNNIGNNSSTFDPVDLKKYTGGDIRGLINKLPYLKSLGITSIWITPPVDNSDNLDVNGGAAYHGYWGKDFFKVDEHLGTIEDFKELSDLMHSAEYNMKLILDYAPNHSNANDENEYGALYRQGQFVTDYNTDLSSSTNWYHHNGGVTDWNDWYQVRYHNLFNLSDFNQSNPDVYQYLLDGTKFWIDAGVDAIRIDAIKHIDISFIQKWTSDTRAYAATLGRDEFYFFGEWFGASADTTTGIDGYAIDYANNSGSALLDFGFRNTMERVLTNRTGSTMHTLNQYLETKKDVFNNDDWQVVFLDNHDMARISTALRSSSNTFGPGNNESGGGQDEEFAKKRVDVGLVATMTVRGIPAIYYGTEHYSANFNTNAFGQVGSDPFNREIMPSFNLDTKAASIIKSLAKLRSISPAIQKGTYSQRWINDDVLVFERKYEDDVVLVALNIGNTVSINVNNLSLNDGTYQNIIGNDDVTISNSSMILQMNQNEAVVLHGTTNNPLKSITFTCNNGETIFGQSVYAVGNTDLLGNWIIDEAVILLPTNYPSWSKSISVPSESPIKWKCLKRSESNPNEQVEWQGGDNNVFEPNSSTQTIGSF